VVEGDGLKMVLKAASYSCYRKVRESINTGNLAEQQEIRRLGD
jgi:hypothetical protein